MAYELLEKELKDLPESSIVDVIEYIRFLKFKLQKTESICMDEDFYLLFLRLFPVQDSTVSLNTFVLGMIALL